MRQKMAKKGLQMSFAHNATSSSNAPRFVQKGSVLAVAMNWTFASSAGQMTTKKGTIVEKDSAAKGAARVAVQPQSTRVAV
jgi:hypothetical protein